MRAWADDNLESSKILVFQGGERWFNPLWGGIPHRVWFDWWKTADIRDRPLQEWIDDYHVTWALIPLEEHQRLENSQSGQEILDRMLLLRNFYGPQPRPRTPTLLYRLWRMQHETDIRFGDRIRLGGYDLHSPDPQPGDDLEVTLYWNASATPAAIYSLFLHFTAVDDPRPLAQFDGNPAVPARQTQTWDRPEETLISPRFSLTLPDDLPPGEYRVMLGLYNAGTGERLPLRDASDAPLGDAWELLRLSVPGQ